MDLRRRCLWSWKAGGDFGDYCFGGERMARAFRKAIARKARKRVKRFVDREIRSELE